MDRLFEIESPFISLDEPWSGSRHERRVVDDVTYKWCVYGRHWTDVRGFSPDHYRGDNLHSDCRYCRKEMQDNSRANKPAKERMLVAQDYKCAL